MTLSGVQQTPAVRAEDARDSKLLVVGVILVLTAAASIAALMQWYTAWAFITWDASDLSVYRQAGEVISSGQPLYDVKFAPGYWTYPPFGGLVMTPLTMAPLEILFPLSYVVNAGALALVILLTGQPLLRRAPDAFGRALLVVGLTLVALTVTPVAEVLALGQLGLLLMLGCCLDYLVVGRRLPRAQGVLVGIATAVKLTPGIFVLHWLATRQYRAAVTALATTAGCWLLAAVVLRGDTATYVERLVLFRTNEQIDGFGDSIMNQSWRGLVDGLPSPAASTLWLVLVALTLALGLTGASRAVRVQQPVAAVGILGLASVLVTPISWHHHAVWVVPALLALVGDGRHRVRLAGATLITVLLMLPARVPAPLPDRYTMLYVVLLGWLLVLVWQASAATDRRLSRSLDRYYGEAYESVMYTGAVGFVSDWVHRLMERPFRASSSGRVLELGAGAGQHAAYVRDFDSYLETDLLVPAGDAVRRVEPGGSVVRARLDAEDLGGLDNASFDRVIATCLLAHLHHPHRALSEWRRVTRPGGTITIYLPMEPGMLLRLLRRIVMVPKARKLGQDHERTVAIDHRNHYPAMRAWIETEFAGDHIRRARFPIPWLGWNFALFDIVHVTRSATDRPG